MSARPWRGAVASLALAAASLTSVVGPAGADDDPAESTVKTIDADTLRHAPADPRTALARDHVRTNFLADSASNGRLYDASEVKTAVVDDVTVAWHLGSTSPGS